MTTNGTIKSKVFPTIEKIESFVPSAKGKLSLSPSFPSLLLSSADLLSWLSRLAQDLEETTTTSLKATGSSIPLSQTPCSSSSSQLHRFPFPPRPRFPFSIFSSSPSLTSLSSLPLPLSPSSGLPTSSTEPLEPLGESECWDLSSSRSPPRMEPLDTLLDSEVLQPAGSSRTTSSDSFSVRILEIPTLSGTRCSRLRESTYFSLPFRVGPVSAQDAQPPPFPPPSSFLRFLSRFCLFVGCSTDERESLSLPSRSSISPSGISWGRFEESPFTR